MRIQDDKSAVDHFPVFADTMMASLNAVIEAEKIGRGNVVSLCLLLAAGTAHASSIDKDLFLDAANQAFDMLPLLAETK